MRTRSAWLVLVLALCACGKAFEASSDVGGVSAMGGASAGGAGGASVGSGGTGGGGAGGAVTHAGSAGVAGSSITTGGTGSGGVLGIGGTLGLGGLMNVGGAPMAGAGGTPAIPTNGLSLWLRADQGVMQKDGLVQQWLDQSGQHMDAIQTASNVQPKFVATGLNGRPTLEFDGTDDFMKLPEGFADFSQGLSIFIVSKATNGSCASMLEVSNGSEVQDVSLGFYQFAWQYEVQNEDAKGGVIDPPTAVPALITAVQRSSGAVELRQNSALLNPGQQPFLAPEVVLRRQNFIAQTLYQDCGYFEGQISEIAVYDRGVTDKEVLAIESYLRDRWMLKATP